MFDTNFYIQNRKKLAAACPGSIIVIAGNGLMQRSGDTNFAFRQDSNFLYLSGIAEPNFMLVIDNKNGDEFLVIPERKGIYEIFDGAFDKKNIQSISGIQQIFGEKEGIKKLIETAINRKVAFNVPSPSRLSEAYANPHRRYVYSKLKRAGLTIEDVRPKLANMRMVKQAPEIQAIQKAIDITKVALAKAEKLLPKTNKESDLLRAINEHFVGESVAHAFEPIVASGFNATTIHYLKNNDSFKHGEAVLFDVGAEFNNYAADISRTFLVKSPGNDRIYEVIEAVRAAQSEIVAAIRPGITWKEISDMSEVVVGRALIELKVIKNIKDVRKYYPHAIGHHLGLDVHDIGDYTQPFVEGMVIAIEPGIYIPEESIGVRIEDDILITKTGSKML